jgi:hypothetical protein
MTKDERAHMSKVAGLGCIVCRNLGYGESPAALHHIRSGQGMSQRASHYQVLPLCGTHHQTGGYGVAIHCGQKEWESRYGTELELLEQVYAEIGFHPE